jgi:hypothetical protein
MTLRHKAIKATLDKGYASEWNDDHEIDFTDELDFFDTFWYDSLAAWWSNAQCANGGTAAIAMVNHHNFAVLTSTNAAGGIGSMRLGTADMTNKSDLPTAHFAINIGTTGQHEFGFFRSADTPFTANQSGAYFRIVNNVLYAVTGNGTAETTTELGPPETYNVYWIEFTSTSVKFYVGGRTAPVATHTTNIPTDDMTIKLSAKVYGGVSQVLRTDGVGIRRLRKK